MTEGEVAAGTGRRAKSLGTASKVQDGLEGLCCPDAAITHS